MLIEITAWQVESTMTDGPDPWLWRGTSDEERVVLPRLGAVLKEYRRAHGLTQAALGEFLGVDQTYVSMIERGRRQIRDVGFLLRVCRLLGIPPADLGLSNELLTGGPAGLVGSVGSSQDEWRTVRRHLNHH